MKSKRVVKPIPAITYSALLNPIDTSAMFKDNYIEPNLSPIDQYIENTKALNVIYLGAALTKEMATIIILGYMSAVESYLRALFRGVISIDEVAQKLVEKNDIPYAAALHHDRKLLPEALFEGTSLASPKNISDTMREKLGIKGERPSDVKKVLDEFSKICELRHCCVHRFGKLGAKNASSLGLTNHSFHLEKPLDLEKKDLEEISYILRSVVNTLNRFIFEQLLHRMAINKNDSGEKLYSMDWSWNLNKDKKRFLNYYKLFASRNDATPSPDFKTIYYVYKGNYKDNNNEQRK